jgi:hypothetical protein
MDSRLIHKLLPDVLRSHAMFMETLKRGWLRISCTVCTFLQGYWQAITWTDVKRLIKEYIGDKHLRR